MTPRGLKPANSDQHPGHQDSQTVVPPQAEVPGGNASIDGVSESYLASSSTSAESKKNGQNDSHLADQVKGLMDDLSRVDISSGSNDALLTAASSSTLIESRPATEDQQ